MLITYLLRAELSPHRPQQTFPCTYKHPHWHTRWHAHLLAHTQAYNGCHCSSSTHLLNTGTFTIETSEDQVDKLEGIPLTKAPVKTVCRLMIDYIQHSAGRAEHGTSYATLLNSRFYWKRQTARAIKHYTEVKALLLWVILLRLTVILEFKTLLKCKK